MKARGLVLSGCATALALLAGCGGHGSATHPIDAAAAMDRSESAPDSPGTEPGGADAPEDRAVDAPTDRSMDTPEDQSVDASSDRPVDAPTDRGTDGALEAGASDGPAERPLSGERCASLPLATGRDTEDVILADMDGDGDLDVVTAEHDGHVTIIRQVAPRSFAAPEPHDVTSGGYPNFLDAVAAADLDGDGALDLALLDSFGTVSTIETAGSGSLGGAVLVGTLAGDQDDVAAADLDGDGQTDMVVVGAEKTFATYFWGNGTGGFLPPVQQTICDSPFRVIVTDLDENGLPDLVIACVQGSSRFLINKGNRSFDATGIFGIAETDGIAVGDLNHDHHADIVAADYNGKALGILLGTGAGTFTVATGQVPTTAKNPISVALGDFDGDGLVDAAVGHDTDMVVMVFPGTGDGRFKPGQSIAVPGIADHIAAGDIDGDGFDDFVVERRAMGLTVFFGPCP